MEYIGTPILKYYVKRSFNGIVVNYEKPYFIIEYQDGDKEKMTLDEMLKWCVDNDDYSGALYMVGDKSTRGKYKIGCTRKTFDIYKYLKSRYGTAFGRGNVNVYKVVMLKNVDPFHAELEMLNRFGLSRGEGEIVYGSTKEVMNLVF